MIISRSKYRRLRHRVSVIPCYWRLYEKKFPKNSLLLFYFLKLDYIYLEEGYAKLTRRWKLPFTNKVFIFSSQYDSLCRYAKVSRKIRSSLKRKRPIKYRKK